MPTGYAGGPLLLMAHESVLDVEWTPFIFDREIENGRRLYVNSRYHVIVQECPSGITWLSIRENNRGTTHDWRDFQRIKNELCGENREGCELYPDEARLVDLSNQFHLWVLPAEMAFPFGFDERMVNANSFDGSTQRPYDNDVAPDDLIPEEELKAKLASHRG